MAIIFNLSQLVNWLKYEVQFCILFVYHCITNENYNWDNTRTIYWAEDVENVRVTLPKLNCVSDSLILLKDICLQ